MLYTQNTEPISLSLPPALDPASANAPLLVLDLGLDVVDGVGRLHLKGDSLAREGLDEDLHLRGR